MIVGYARVSRDDQNLSRQVTALNAAGCEVLYLDKISGAKRSRPEMDRMLAELKPGDLVIVAKLDRFGRSISHLTSLMDDFSKRNIGFKSINDSFDTTTANGRLMLHMLAAFAEFERDLIRERTKDGLKQAKMDGKKLGRPYPNQDELINTVEHFLAGGIKANAIMIMLNLTKGQYYRIRNKCKNGNKR